MKNRSTLVRQQPYAEQQRRSSAPILNHHRLSPPPFTSINQQTRHTSFRPHPIQQQQQQLALNPSSPQPHRLSIAERFMSSTPPVADFPMNDSSKTDDPSPLPNSDMINNMDYLQPHSSPTVPFAHPTIGGHSHNLKQPGKTNRSSWSPSLQPSAQPKRQFKKSKRPLTDQPPSRRPPKSSTTALPAYGENVDMEKAAAAAATAAAAVTATTTTASPATYTKGDRHQHERNTMNMDAPLEGFWYCHRGCLLLCIFFFILVLGFLLFLVWPRVPLLRIEGASVVSPVEIVQTQQGWMENVMFTTSWLVNVTVDNRQNYIPTRLNKVQVIVKDAVTNALVGKGTHNDDNMDWVLMDGISTMSVLVTVNYQARDMSDTTFLDLAHACHRAAADMPATSLPLHFWFTLYMFGFDWLGFTPTIIATPASSGFFCPV